MNQLRSLQKITDNQLRNSKLQLLELKKQSSPRLEMTNFHTKRNDNYALVGFEMEIRNLGLRYAKDVSLYICLFNDKIEIQKKIPNIFIANKLNPTDWFFYNTDNLTSIGEFTNIRYFFMSLKYRDEYELTFRKTECYDLNTDYMKCSDDLVNKMMNKLN